MPEKILLIDDDAFFVDAMKTAIVSRGYSVITASNGKEGIEKAKLENPDLVVLDVMMTNRTEGIYVCRNLRSDPRLKNTPIIMLSAIGTIEKGFDFSPDEGWLPADKFLSKPIDVKVLSEEIRIALEKKKAMRAKGPQG